MQLFLLPQIGSVCACKVNEKFNSEFSAKRAKNPVFGGSVKWAKFGMKTKEVKCQSLIGSINTVSKVPVSVINVALSAHQYSIAVPVSVGNSVLNAIHHQYLFFSVTA